MNKTAIKNFAIWARNKLIADISYRAGLMGITTEGIQKALPQSTGTTEFYDIGTAEPYSISGTEVKQREKLVELIRRKEKETNYKTAYKYVLEEVAYTWFNRLIAVRFMEVNDYLPSHIRVLSSDSGKTEPDLLANPFDAELSFTEAEEQEIYGLRQENKSDEAFRLLFIKQCNALNEILPALFEKTSDYTELLLNLSVIDQDGVIWHLVHDIPEEDFDIKRGGQVEIIGWLYQYYNTELNSQVYDGNMSKNRVPKELLPAATTIYTPDWTIRYMVENSLGRLWVEGHPNEELKAGWKYYLEEAEQEPEVQAQLAEIRKEYAKLNPKEIKVIDPCMGSGHVLVYAFDVLMQIYESAGYSQRDAARSILENNLYGLDIDDRAFQLAYFAIMMKARQYNRRILNGESSCHIYAIQESNGNNRVQLNYFGIGMEDVEKNAAKVQVENLLSTLTDAKEYGSILRVENYNWDLLHRFVAAKDTDGQISIDSVGVEDTGEQLNQLISIGKAMAQKYFVIITNPPYLGSGRFSEKLNNFVVKEYPTVKSDLSMVMYEHALCEMSRENGFVSFITTSSWMTLSSFEKMRKLVLNNYDFHSLVDFGTELFDGKVGHNPIVAWINRISNTGCMMTSIRLVDYCYSRRNEKKLEFFNAKNLYYTKQSSFFNIPGSPLAYWISPSLFKAFAGTKISDFGTAKVGIGSGNTDYFLKIWHEVAFHHITFGAERTDEVIYAPINKGGGYRKWYGNNLFVIKWIDDGSELKNYCDERGNKLSYPRNLEYQLKECLTWGDISSGDFSLRWSPRGYFFSDVGNSLFIFDHEKQYYILAFGNTKLFNDTTDFLNQTMHFKPGNMLQMPLIYKHNEKKHVDNLTVKCIELCQQDWDSFEISWDFKKHPLVNGERLVSNVQNTNYHTLIIDHYKVWETVCNDCFNQLKANEEELNQIFIDIYGLHDEMIPEVEDKNVTVRKADLQRDIKSLLSYAIGCMFGRYSLDMEGLTYAGGEWDSSKYQSFIPDADNIIPITDEEYLEDDIISRLCEFLKVVYGEQTLEENLDFIAKALGNKGDSSREIIRNYFLNDFFKDHCQTYSVTGSGKRPIYWLFDAGKNNGFKALIYLHRYNADTIGNLRIDYLHRMQHIYESEMSRMQDMIDHSTNAREVAQASKRREKLTKQLKECREYDEKLAHLALSRIELDLDDGVKKNYRKIQTANDEKFYEVLADSKNIMSKE